VKDGYRGRHRSVAVARSSSSVRRHSVLVISYGHRHTGRRHPARSPHHGQGKSTFTVILSFVVKAEKALDSNKPPNYWTVTILKKIEWAESDDSVFTVCHDKTGQRKRKRQLSPLILVV